MDFLNKLLNKQSHFFPVITTPEEVAKYKRDFDALLSLSVLEKISDPQHIWCKTCQSEGVEVHYVSKDRAYTICTQREDAGRDYFNPSEIKQWQLNTPRLLSLFQEALGITTPQVNENIQGLLWNLGTQAINGVHYHLFFCRNIDEIEKPRLSIITALPHSVVFYSGTPHTSLPENLLVPLADLIKSIGKSIVLEKALVEQYFPKDVYATQNDGLELDDTMALQGEYLLFERLRGGIFKQAKKLSPLATRIINHLYGIRKHQTNSKTLIELERDLGNLKRVVSREIKSVQDFCTAKGLSLVLHKYSGNKWGINPQLKCCK